jgi:hypothetical protein
VRALEHRDHGYHREVGEVARPQWCRGRKSEQRAIVHPGQTRDLVSASSGVFNIPSSCIFDLTTKTGARASFVYTSGFNGFTVVIPAQK